MLFQAVSFGIGVYCFTVWVETFVAEFGVGRGRVLLVFVTLQLMLGLLLPLAGRAMDQFNLRWLVILGVLCLSTVGASIGGFLLTLIFTSLLAALGWRGTSLWLAVLVCRTSRPSSLVCGSQLT